MIRITRRSEFIDLLKPYRIFIDGINYGKIKRGETREFKVNGYHTVSVRIGLCGTYRSNTLHIYVNDFEVVDIEINIPTMTGWKRWLPLDWVLANDEHLFLSVLQREK